MEPPAGFTDFVLELLEPMGGVSARRMFGGAGLFSGGVMFGLISGDTLYLKVDDRNRGTYEDAGTGPFLYQRQGRDIALSYYEAPPELFDNPDDLSEWARHALAAALRSKNKKSTRQ